MAEVRIGLIGSGYMGKAHALAYRTVPGVFALPAEPALELLADVDAATAERAGEAFGFARWTGAWRELVSDPAVDLVDITTPNVLHKEMAFAAIDAGKPVYCEKPLAPTAADAKAMVEHAEAAGVKTMVGFNYLKNPITVLAKEIVESGELGEVHAFRGTHFEDYMLDPDSLVSAWRLDPRSGDGVIVDLASHVVSLARYLVGGIDAVCADRDTVVTERRAAAGESATQTVEVADQVRTLLRFAGGAKGTIEASWIATGRKMGIVCEITGNKGALRFDFERLNELHLYTTDQARGREGFKTILTGPDHKDYANFCLAPGHQLGFNDIKVIEVRDLIEGLVAAEARPWPDFNEAWQVQRVIDAISASGREHRWVPTAEF